MPAKHKKNTTAKKTVKKKVPIVASQPQTTVVPDVPIQPSPLQVSPQMAAEQPTSEMPPPSVQQATVIPDGSVVPANSLEQTVKIEDPSTPTTQQQAVVNSPQPSEEDKSPLQPKAEPVVSAEPVLNDPAVKQNAEESLTQDPPHKRNFFLPIIFIVLLALAILGGLFLYKQSTGKSDQGKKNAETVSPTPSENIEESTTQKIDLSKYSIEILNGSGISGEASNQKSSLEGFGFKVESIGNADNSEYAETIIRAKKSVDSAFVGELKKTLEVTYTLGETEVLDKDAETDVVIIVGSQKSR